MVWGGVALRGAQLGRVWAQGVLLYTRRPLVLMLLGCEISTGEEGGGGVGHDACSGSLS